MAAKIVLFYRPLSPPSRAVLLTAKAIEVDFELKNINVLKGEHLTPEYRKVSVCCNGHTGASLLYYPMLFIDESSAYDSDN